MSLDIVKDSHLGGYARANEQYPHGDPDCYFPELWAWMIGRFNVQTLLDVGCAEGHAMKWFADHGIAATGIEGCQEALAKSVMREQTLACDFTQNYLGTLPEFDLVYACEFVEHVEERYANNYLTAFQRGKVLAITHAFPGQEGWHHVNCHDSLYWIKWLTANGFTYDAINTLESRRFDAYSHWRRSGLIFRRTT